jgi:hypothetical protein
MLQWKNQYPFHFCLEEKQNMQYSGRKFTKYSKTCFAGDMCSGAYGRPVGIARFIAGSPARPFAILIRRHSVRYATPWVRD